MISRLFWLSRKNQRIPTLSSHRTNCKRTQSCKIEIRDKALKVADGFMQDNAIKIQYALNMLVLLIIEKNGFGNQGLQNQCRSRKREAEKRFSKKITKAGKEKRIRNS
jgi:hypothetical protein